jgi:integrase
MSASPTTVHFTDRFVEDVSYKSLRKKVLKRQGKDADDPTLPMKPIDLVESRRRGLALLLTAYPSGTKVWSKLVYVKGRPRREKLGAFPDITSKKARDKVDETKLDEVRAAAEEPTVEIPESFEAVKEWWVREHVDGEGLRTAGEIKRLLKQHIPADWSKRKYTEVRRPDVKFLLDRVARDHGRRTSDCVLTVLRSMSNWYADYDETYQTPFVRRVRKKDKRKPKDRRRKHVLSDVDIAAVWAACDELGQFGDFIRLALLCGQRKTKVASMKWSDLDGDLCTIATEEREKGNAGAFRLPPLAMEIIERQPRFSGNPYVFASPRAGKHIGCWNKPMRALRKLLPTTPHFVIHDLRRTCRSLMSRLGVYNEHAELVLGHARSLIEETYDRYEYITEKSEALQTVADHIASLVPTSPKVVGLSKRAA